METKSRYEVIADLEAKKRELIKEKDELKDVLSSKEKALKNTIREKDDVSVKYERKISDLQDDIDEFKERMSDRQDVLDELIASVNTSLDRFQTVAKGN